MSPQRFESRLSGDPFALKRAISTKTMIGAHHRMIRQMERLGRGIWRTLPRWFTRLAGR